MKYCTGKVKILVIILVVMAVTRPDLYIPRKGGTCFLSDKQHEELKFLIIGVCHSLEELDVTYWLDYGTLLGAMREGGIIRHDYDGDISTISNDKPYTDDLRKLLHKSGITLDPERCEDYPCFSRAHYKSRSLDLFNWRIVEDVCNDGGTCKLVERPANEPYSNLPVRMMIAQHERVPLTWILPTKLVPFYDDHLSVPNEPYTIIKNRYPFSHSVTFPYKHRCWIPYLWRYINGM